MNPHPHNVKSNLDFRIHDNTAPSNTTSSYFHSQSQDKAINDTNSLEKALAETVNLNRLPVPEPTVSTGDPLRCMEWKTSFTMLIDRKGVPTSEKIFYLKRYLGGEALRPLEGVFTVIVHPPMIMQGRCLMIVMATPL